MMKSREFIKIIIFLVSYANLAKSLSESIFFH